MSDVSGADPRALRDEPSPVSIVSGETVFSGHVWNVRSETFDYNGVETTREFVDHPGAAAVIAIDDERRVLLIQQYRHPIRMRDWETRRDCWTCRARIPRMPHGASSRKRPISWPSR